MMVNNFKFVNIMYTFLNYFLLKMSNTFLFYNIIFYINRIEIPRRRKKLYKIKWKLLTIFC